MHKHENEWMPHLSYNTISEEMFLFKAMILGYWLQMF